MAYILSLFNMQGCIQHLVELYNELLGNNQLSLINLKNPIINALIFLLHKNIMT